MHSIEKQDEIVEKEIVLGIGVQPGTTIKSVGSIDSFHHDEAAKIIEEYTAGDGVKEWTESEERRLLRKVDWKLMPILCFTLFMQFYDKSILAQAVRSNHPKLGSPNDHE